MKDSTELNRESLKTTNNTEKVSTDGQTKYIDLFLYFLEIYALTFLKSKYVIIEYYLLKCFIINIYICVEIFTGLWYFLMEQTLVKERLLQVVKVTVQHRICLTLCKFTIHIFLHIDLPRCNFLFGASCNVLLRNVVFYKSLSISNDLLKLIIFSVIVYISL